MTTIPAGEASDEIPIQIMGGPLHPETQSLLIRSLRTNTPEYFCHRPAGDRWWHHYATGSEAGVFVYAGRCADIAHKHGQPHEHELDECRY